MKLRAALFEGSGQLQETVGWKDYSKVSTHAESGRVEECDDLGKCIRRQYQVAVLPKET
jgi:hypothetical protein